MKCTILSLLNSFYETDTGCLFASEVSRSITSSININNDNLLAIGIGESFLGELDNGNLLYAIPKLYPFKHWPKIRPFRTIVVDETTLPFLPNSIDTVLVIHMMEFSKKNFDFLQEIFRVLKIGGRLVVISANKNNYNIFRRYNISEKYIQSNIEEIIYSISDASFNVSNVFGINKKFRFWPYNFSYNFNKYNELLISFFPLLSDIVVIVSEKIERASEAIKTLDTQYEAL